MLLHQLSERYDFDHLKPVNDGFRNTVYTFHRAGQQYFLRVTPSGYRSLEELESELDLIFALEKHGVSVAMPVASKRGKLIECINDQEQQVFIVVFEKAPGNPVNVTDRSDWNPELFFQWGRQIGRMHQTSKTLKDKLHRPRWTKDNADLLKLLPNIQSAEIKQEYLLLLESLNSFNLSHDDFGLIHNDLHQGNFHVNEGKITIYDFDDCAYHWFAYDLAASYYHAYWQTLSFAPDYPKFSNTFWKHFLKGYQLENELTRQMILQIPIFLKIREIFLYQLFLEKWDLNRLEEWQEYTLSDLKKKIEQKIPYSDYNFSLLLKEMFDTNGGSTII